MNLKKPEKINKKSTTRTQNIFLVERPKMRQLIRYIMCRNLSSRKKRKKRKKGILTNRVGKLTNKKKQISNMPEISNAIIISVAVYIFSIKLTNVAAKINTSEAELRTTCNKTKLKFF